MSGLDVHLGNLPIRKSVLCYWDPVANVFHENIQWISVDFVTLLCPDGVLQLWNSVVPQIY